MKKLFIIFIFMLCSTANFAQISVMIDTTFNTMGGQKPITAAAMKKVVLKLNTQKVSRAEFYTVSGILSGLLVAILLKKK